MAWQCVVTVAQPKPIYCGNVAVVINVSIYLSIIINHYSSIHSIPFINPFILPSFVTTSSSFPLSFIPFPSFIHLVWQTDRQTGSHGLQTLLPSFICLLPLFSHLPSFPYSVAHVPMYLIPSFCCPSTLSHTFIRWRLGTFTFLWCLPSLHLPVPLPHLCLFHIYRHLFCTHTYPLFDLVNLLYAFLAFAFHWCSALLILSCCEGDTCACVCPFATAHTLSPPLKFNHSDNGNRWRGVAWRHW